MRKPHHGPGGFTLVELLIVIGLIVILIGMLLPAVTLARRTAGQARCASNLRQWSIAVNLYAVQNKNWLPRRGQGKMPTSQVNLYDDWFNELPQLLGQKMYQDLVSSGQLPSIQSGNNIWVCPELNGNPNSFGHLFGYAMNMALSVRSAEYPDRITRIGSPSSMVFMADGPPGFCSTIPYASTSAAPAIFNPVARHNSKVNLSFLDGHVSAYTGKYVGCNISGDPIHPDGCNQPDVRWYWYAPGPSPAPWTGP